MKKQPTYPASDVTAGSPSSGLRTISGNPSILRNADVGHMLELREKLAGRDMEITMLQSAVRNLRDVQGRHHTQIAMDRLIALLPENAELMRGENGTNLK